MKKKMNEKIFKTALRVAFLGLALSAFARTEAAEPPVPAPAEPAAGPRRVVVGTYVNHIYAVDMKNNQYSVDFYVWFRWPGDDLKVLDSFELPSGRITSKTGISKKKIGDQNYAACRVLATITKFWDLRRFPLDDHTLTIEIEDSEHEDHAVVFVPDMQNAGIGSDLQVPGWVVTKTGAQVVRQTYRTNYGDVSLPTNNESAYSRYVYSLEVRRPGYGRFIKVFFGLFIATLIAWCAFLVKPKDLGPRVSLGIGATFAAAAVTIAINNNLPDTNAVTMADKLIMLSLGAILSSVILTIVALTLVAKGKEDIQRRVDRWLSILFPLTYLVVLLVIIR